MIIVEIAGRLGQDPESRFTPSGQKVTTMRVATNVRKAGKDETVWWRVTIWGDRFDKMLTYLKKGSGIIVVGNMGKPEIYNDKEGRPQISMELTAEMLHFSPFGNSDTKAGENAGASRAPAAASKEAAYAGTGTAASSFGAFPADSSGPSDLDDEMPF